MIRNVDGSNSGVEGGCDGLIYQGLFVYIDASSHTIMMVVMHKENHLLFLVLRVLRAPAARNHLIDNCNSSSYT